MKFAHISDAHIGGWREPKLRKANLEAFQKAIEKCKKEKVDFILIAGDLFDTAIPPINLIREVTSKLREVKKENIPAYIIPGSHDYSPSGKTMINVLETAGLITNVCKGEVKNKKLKLKMTEDQKTGAKITGMIGKAGMLDRKYYEDLDRESLEKETGFKIFMFHTSLTQLKPKHLEEMNSQPVSLLPKGFDYYAGGHVHHKNEYSSKDYKMVTQPGALFPNNFREIEKYSHGGFYIVEDPKNPRWVPVKVKQHIGKEIDCESLKPIEIEEKTLEKFENEKLEDTIITLRFKGEIKGGKVGDISFKKIFEKLYSKGAYAVLRNTAKLTSQEYEEVKVEERSIEEIEEKLIKEHTQQVEVDLDSEKEVDLTKKLMSTLSTNKKEGETNKDFKKRVKEEADDILRLQNLP